MIQRKIDHMGRIVIPKNFMKDLSWEENTRILITKKNGSLVITKADPTCLCCGSSEHLVSLDENVFVCKACLQKLAKSSPIK